MTGLFEFDAADYPRLLVLARLIAECRFPETHFDGDIWMSSDVIDMHDAVVAAQRRHLVDRGDWRRVEKLDAFYTWGSSPSTQRIATIFVERVRENAAELTYVLEGGPDRVKQLLRPYRLSDLDAQAIVQQVSGADR